LLVRRRPPHPGAPGTAGRRRHGKAYSHRRCCRAHHRRAAAHPTCAPGRVQRQPGPPPPSGGHAAPPPATRTGEVSAQVSRGTGARRGCHRPRRRRSARTGGSSGRWQRSPKWV